MTEHLPHDEQRLLGHGARRPQVLGDPVGVGGALLEHGEDALAAPPVLGEAAAHQAAVIGDRRRRDRSAAGPSGIDAVRSRLARYWIRACGRDPVGSATGTISAFDEMPASR